MIDQIDSIFQKQQIFKVELRLSDVNERIEKLRKLRRVIESKEDLIYEALAKDLRKSKNEAAISEVLFIYGEIKFAIRHLRTWMRPKRVGRSLTNLLAKSSIVYQPKGTVLIISPWNYPFQLTMSPLVSAIAAGNCIVLKPSEHSPYTSSVIRMMISEAFDCKEIVCIEGEKSTAETLLKLPFDHIFLPVVQWWANRL